jgi:hypothetical protein
MTSSKAQVCALPSETNCEIVTIEFTFTKKIKIKILKLKVWKLAKVKKKPEKETRKSRFFFCWRRIRIRYTGYKQLWFVLSFPCVVDIFICTCYYTIRFSIFSLLGSLVRAGGSVQNLQIPKNENVFLGAMRKRDKRLGTLITPILS